MVDRLFVEKKPGFDNEARALLKDARSFLGVTNLTGLRLFNRYDVEGLDAALLRRRGTASFPSRSSTKSTTNCRRTRAWSLPRNTCRGSSTSAPTPPPSASS